MNKKKYPQLSIIVPTYNRADLLKECLDSILEQDYPNLEIIVSDDNSTDKTEEIVKKYVAQDPVIRYVKNCTYPKGPNGNKNNGFDHVKGDIIAILDDDDTLRKGALILMVDKLLEGYDVILGNCRIFSDDESDGAFSGKGKNSSGDVCYSEIVCSILSGEFWMLYKADVIGDRRFDTDLYGGECTLWKSVFKDKKIYYIHEAVRNYRKQGQNITSNMQDKAGMVIKNYERDIEYFGKEMMKSCPEHLAELYKNATYYAKLAGQYKKAFVYIFKGLRISFRKDLILMFILIFIPKVFFPFLLKLKN